MRWITESNRLYHLFIGFVAALFGTLIGAIEVGVAMECKDCHHDKINAGLPPWKWHFLSFDWLDFSATVLGGAVGQAVQLLIIMLIR